MRNRHDRASPDRNEKTEIERMANDFIQKGFRQIQGRIGSVSQTKIDLSQAKKIPEIDKHSRTKKDGPSNKIQGIIILPRFIDDDAAQTRPKAPLLWVVKGILYSCSE